MCIWAQRRSSIDCMFFASLFPLSDIVLINPSSCPVSCVRPQTCAACSKPLSGMPPSPHCLPRPRGRRRCMCRYFTKQLVVCWEMFLWEILLPGNKCLVIGTVHQVPSGAKCSAGNNEILGSLWQRLLIYRYPSPFTEMPTNKRLHSHDQLTLSNLFFPAPSFFFFFLPLRYFPPSLHHSLHSSHWLSSCAPSPLSQPSTGPPLHLPRHTDTPPPARPVGLLSGWYLAFLRVPRHLPRYPSDKLLCRHINHQLSYEHDNCRLPNDLELVSIGSSC